MFEKAQSSKRDSSFNLTVGSVFFWNLRFARSFQYFFLWCSNIQCIVILLWIQMNISSDNDQLSTALHLLTRFLSLGDYISSPVSSLNLSMILLAWIYFLFIFILLAVIFTRVYVTGKISKTENYITFFLNQFHLAYGFWTVNTVSIRFANASSLEEEDSINIAGIDIDIFFLKGICIILITMNYLVTSFMAVLSYDPFRSCNLFSTHTPIYQISTFLFKAAILPLVSINMTSELGSWGIALFSLLWSAYRHYKLFETFPYYHYSPMRHSLWLSSVTLLITFFSVFVMAARNSSIVYCFIYIEILLLPFVIKLNNQYLDRIVNQSLQIKNHCSERQVIRELFALTYIVENPKMTLNTHSSKEMKELQLWALWSQYYSDKENLIKIIDPNQGNMYQQIHASYLKHIEEIIITNMMKSVQAIKSSDRLKIILADHLFSLNETSPSAISNLLSLMAKRRSLAQIEATKILKSIEQKLHKLYQNGDTHVFNMKSYVDSKISFNDLLGMIARNSKRVLEIWETYKKPEHKIFDLYLKSQVIENEDNKIRQFWSRVVQLNEKSASSLAPLYCSYLLLVRNAPYSAQKIEKRARLFQAEKAHVCEITEKITRNTQDISKNIIIYVSMSGDKFGRILDISPNVSEIIGWRREELVDKNVNGLVPDFMREKHSQLMLKHFGSIDSSSKLSRNIETFLRAKEGHVLPCYLYLCLYPYIQQELVYVGIIKPKRYSNVEQIIIDQSGRIKAYTKGIDIEKLNQPIGGKCNLTDSLWKYIEFSKTSQTYEADIPVLNTNYSSSLLDRNTERKTNKLPQSVNKIQSLVMKKIGKKARNLAKYFNDHVMNKSLYSFFGETFIVLNLEKTGEVVKDALPQQQQQDNLSQYKTAKYVKYDQEEECNVPEERTENDAEENNTLRNTIAPSNRLLDGRKSNYNSSIEILYDPPESKKRLNCEDMAVKLDKTALVDSSSAVDSEKGSSKSNEKQVHPGILQSSYSSQNSSLSNRRIVVEKAFYSIPKDPKIRNLGFYLSGFIGLSIVLLGCFQVQNNKTLALLEGNIDILNNQTLMLLNILNLNKQISYFSLFDNGIVSVDRFAWAGIPDPRFICQIQIGLLANNLRIQNIAIRNSLYKIDENLRHKLYDKISVVDQNRSINSFDLVSEVIAATYTITNRPYNTIKADDTDVDFVYKNTQNEVLISGETAINVMINDTLQKLDTDLRLIIVFLFLSVIIILVLLVYLLSILLDIIQDRNKILEIFLRLGEKSVDNHITMLKSFCGTLEKYSASIQKLNIQLTKASFLKTDAHISKTFTGKKKETNIQGINDRIKKIMLIIFCLFMSILSGSATVLGMVDKQNKEISQKVNIMANANANLYNFAILFNYFLEYIHNNSTSTLRGKPIQEEWENTFNRLSSFQEQFLSITDPNLGIGPNPLVLEIIEGNLCKIIAADPYAGAQCASMLYGIPQKGLIRLNSFMMSLVQRLKLHFDYSARRKEDMINVFNVKDLNQAEAVMVLYLYPAYEMIGRLVKEQLYELFSEFNSKILKTVIGFMVISACFGGVLGYKLKQALLKQKHSWRKLLLLVPADMFTTNKLLQAYLLHNALND